MFRCNICLKTFAKKYNMLRHKNSTHSDRNSDSDEEKTSDGSIEEDIFGPVDKREDNNSDYDLASDSDGNSGGDNDVASKQSSAFDPWDDIVEEAFEKCSSQFDSEVHGLIEEDADMSEDEARETVFRNMRSAYRDALMNAFGSKLVWFNVMRKDLVYKSVLKTVHRLIDEDDYDKEEALKYGILKRKFLFDNILATYELPELQDSDAMEHENATEQEEQSK